MSDETKSIDIIKLTFFNLPHLCKVLFFLIYWCSDWTHRLSAEALVWCWKEPIHLWWLYLKFIVVHPGQWKSEAVLRKQFCCNSSASHLALMQSEVFLMNYFWLAFRSRSVPNMSLSHVKLSLRWPTVMLSDWVWAYVTMLLLLIRFQKSKIICTTCSLF